MTSSPLHPGPADPAAHGLAARLRRATAQAHERIERTGVIAELIDGTISPAAYVRLLRSLVPIYAALEAGLRRHRRLPAIAPAVFPALFRHGALVDDLRVLAGPGWAADVTPVAEAEEYRRHLHALSDRQPQALLAHAYVRYLGDLSGGVLIARSVGARFGLTPGRGLAFYAFTRAGTPTARQFRAALDACPMNEADAAAIEAEALHAFERHERLAVAIARGS